MPPKPATERLRAVLAEDEPADEMVIREALSRRFPDLDLTVRRDGEQMMRWIDLVDTEYIPLPDVILLDLNLPRFTGEEILERLRENSKCQSVQVVIVTSSDHPHDHASALRLGAARYFRKSTQYEDFMKLGDVVYDLLVLPARVTAADV